LGYGCDGRVVPVFDVLEDFGEALDVVVDFRRPCGVVVCEVSGVGQVPS
jgi:hypothetical protein